MPNVGTGCAVGIRMKVGRSRGDLVVHVHQRSCQSSVQFVVRVVLVCETAPSDPSSHQAVWYTSRGGMRVLSAVLAQLWTGVRATRQEPVVELRKKEVEGSVKIGIVFRFKSEFIVFPNLERVDQPLDLCRVHLVPAVGFSDVPEASHEGCKLRVIDGVEQSGACGGTERQVPA